MPSATPRYVPARMTWLTALTAWPAPIGPTWVIVLPSAVEDRPGPLDVGRVAADEDRERRLAGALAAARDRRVDHARRRARASRAAKSQLPDGAMVEQSMTSVPGRAPSTTPSGAEQDGLDVRRVGDADDDDVRRRRRPGPAVGGQGDAEIVELGAAAGRPVPAGDREPGPREVGGHRRAHRPEAEEGDPAAFG